MAEKPTAGMSDIIYIARAKADWQNWFLIEGDLIYNSCSSTEPTCWQRLRDTHPYATQAQLECLFTIEQFRRIVLKG